MDNVHKLPTKLQDQPISFQLTLHKERLEAHYKKQGSNFKDEFTLAKKGIGACVHMHNLIQTYGVECIEYFLTTFFGQKVG